MVDDLQNLTLHTHLEHNDWVTGCLVCEKQYEQVIEESAAYYLHQTAQIGESVREQQLKGDAFIPGLQSEVFTFIP